MKKVIEISEVVADEIKSISEGVRKLLSGKLNKRAIVVLIQESAPQMRSGYTYKKISKTEIDAILENMSNLDKYYLNKSKEQIQKEKDEKKK
jgi:predicted transcriptional regulator